MLDIVLRYLGIATTSDMRNLERKISRLAAENTALAGKVDAIDQAFNEQIRDIQRQYHESSSSFSGHRNKTEAELAALAGELGQIIGVLEHMQAKTKADDQLSQFKKMAAVLKAKRTKAINAINSIKAANTDGQIDSVLDRAANNA